MWVFDWETLAILEVNDAAISFYGYSRDEFLALHITDLRPVEEIPRLKQVLAGKCAPLAQSGPWKHRRKDGQMVEVEVMRHGLEWSGRPAALIVAHNITGRVRAEESLRESEERFRTAFECAPFGMALTTLDGCFLQVNAALCQMLGYSEKELVSGAWRNLTHPADLERSLEAAAQLKKQLLTSVEFEKRYIHKSGKIIWARLRVTVVKDRHQQPSHFITHMDDISERVWAERARRDSEEKYRNLITHMPDVVWVAEASGAIVFVSPNVESLTGLTADEVYQRGARALFESIETADAERVTEAFRALFTRARPYDEEFRVRAKSGEWIWVHDRAVAAYEKDGSCYATGLRSDITEHRRAEAAMRERDAAEQANRAKSAFLARMSHELRTPLNAIIGYSQMLREDCTGPQQTEFAADLEKIERAGLMLLGLINDVLDLSKVEAGRMDVHLEDVEVDSVFQDVRSGVEPLALQQGNRLFFTCAPDARSVYADRTKLRQCILNLVNNACKFTRQGEITVTARRVPNAAGGWIELRIADTGIGIPSEHLGKLFDPFFQVEGAAVSKISGTGLGLAITKRFCELMHGEIAVESIPRQGSCFSLRLPACRPPT